QAECTVRDHHRPGSRSAPSKMGRKFKPSSSIIPNANCMRCIMPGVSAHLKSAARQSFWEWGRHALAAESSSPSSFGSITCRDYSESHPRTARSSAYHTSRTCIGFDRFVSLVHLLLCNIERLVCRMRLHLPVSSCFDHTTPDPIPSLQPHYRTFVTTTDRPAPVLRFGTLASRFSPACASPLPSEHWSLQFRAKACIRLTPPPRRPPSAQSSGT